MAGQDGKNGGGFQQNSMVNISKDNLKPGQQMSGPGAVRRSNNYNVVTPGNSNLRVLTGAKPKSSLRKTRIEIPANMV